jgi:titin
MSIQVDNHYAVDSSNIYLQWSTSGFLPVPSYKVRWEWGSGNSDSQNVDDDTYYTISGLSPDTTYTFWVELYDLGVYVTDSPYYADVTWTVGPYPPNNISAIIGNGNSLALTWTSPLWNGDNVNGITSSIVNYTLDQSTDNSNWTTINGAIPPTSTAYQVFNLNGTYYFRMSSTNNFNSTSAYAAINTVPTPPNNVSITAIDCNSVTITWQAPSLNIGSPITNYEITCSQLPNATLVSSSVLTYQYTGLTTGTNYSFFVKAQNSSGWSDNSSTVSATTHTAPTAPTFPTNPTNNAIVNLNYSVSSDGGEPIDYYIVNYGTDPNSLTSTVTPNPTSTPITVSGLSPGTTYYFQVTAHNECGFGQPSAVFTAVAAIPPDAPNHLIAKPNLKSVSLTWDIPFNDGGTPITSYIVQYRLFGTSPSSPWIPTTVLGTTPHFIVSGLQDETMYDFQVAAVNSVGTGPYSGIATASTYGLPSAPVNLAAQSGLQIVSLTWDPPLYNGGIPITSYLVEYRISGITPENTWNNPPISVPASLSYSPSQVVTDLQNGTLYDFRVAAVNAVGTGPHSAIVTEPTYAVPTAPTHTVPDAPINLFGIPGTLQVCLTWTAPTNDGGSPITDYLIEYKLDAMPTWIEFNHAPSIATTIVVYGLIGNNLYDFRVFAKNSVGYSGPSNVFKTTPFNVPGPPPWSRAGGNNCPNCDSNYGTSACGDTIKPYSTYALDERRKAEILKYKKNGAQMSKAQQYSMLSRNALTHKKTWATQTQTYTNPNVNNLPERESEGVTVALECNQPPVLYSLTSDCDVPGPVIPLYIDAKIPLYNYKMQVTPSSGGK